jgi:hypothetical protein
VTNRVVTTQEFVTALTELGADEYCGCGSNEVKTYSRAGEMEPLYMVSRDQLEAQLEGTPVPIRGQTVFALNCAHCGQVRLYDPTVLGLA